MAFKQIKEQKEKKKEQITIKTLKNQTALNLIYDIMDELGYPQIARGRGTDPDFTITRNDYETKSYKREKYSTSITTEGGFLRVKKGYVKTTITISTNDPLLITILENPEKILFGSK